MNDADLTDAFRMITASGGIGLTPCAWQRRLFRRLLAGEVPDAVDIPTGLGKTAVIALWLLALASGAPVPRRLIHVVDRRTVVDHATDHARRIRDNLDACPDLREALHLTGKLPISTLRGQHADNRAWLADPAAPAIIIGTVDMIGSRLLFQGYGVSPNMRPMHAGLLGMDALLVLDEAHLSRPFQATVRRVRDLAGDGAVRLMSLGATRRAGAQTVFRLADADAADDFIATRLAAPKALRIETRPGALAADFAQAAWAMGAIHPGARILIFRDRCDEAAAIAAALRKLAGKQPVEIELLTGQRRGMERDRLAKWLETQGFLSGAERRGDLPVFLVATSAGEVGVDLDADHMLCDLVPWERMVQRLGRVNRRGEGAATVAVWDLGEAPGGAADLKRRRLTRALLAPGPGDDSLQVGPGALATLQKVRAEAVRAASTPPPLFPDLTLPLVEAWAMTSLPDHAGRPEVGPWLRGWTDEEPQTRLVWREYLPVLLRAGPVAPEVVQLDAYLAAAPLRPSEQMETRSSRVLDWMKKRGKRLVKRRDRSEAGLPVRQDIAALILDADGSLAQQVAFADWETGDPRFWRRIERSLPGRTLLLRRQVAGLEGDHEIKGGDHTGQGYLDPACDVPPSVGDAETEKFEDVTVDFARLEPRDEGLKPKSAANQQVIRVFVTRIGASGEELDGFAILRRKTGANEDEEARSIFAREQSIEEHSAAVVAAIARSAARLGVRSEAHRAFALSAEAHDTGKGAGRWQRAAGAPPGQILAKTDGKGADWSRLGGYRHEFGSLVRLERRDDLPEDQRDLILHLVASHHGRARPIITADGCDEGPPSAMAAAAGRAALRYARLSTAHGAWRLAWLEAILRAADQQASAAVAKEDGHG